MPELPEVETLRRDLLPHLVGRTFTTVAATGARSVRRSSRAAFEGALTGSSVTGIDRHGKYLLVRLAGRDDAAESDADARARDAGAGDGAATPVLMVHLRMSGQVLFGSRAEDPPIHTHIRLGLSPGDGPDGPRESEELWFVDPRTFGEMWVTAAAPGGLPVELGHLGQDALLDGLIPAAGWPSNRRTAVKALLLDQQFVAGIGNIYADEICHRAGVRVDRPAAKVSRPAAARLAEACADVLEEAVAARGSTLGDGQYVDAYGRTGEFGMRHRVHAREGKPCLKCGRPIERLIVAGRSAYQCRRCQR